MGVFDLLRSAKGTFGIKDPALCIEERQPASAGRRCLEFRIGQMQLSRAKHLPAVRDGHAYLHVFAALAADVETRLYWRTLV